MTSTRRETVKKKEFTSEDTASVPSCELQNPASGSSNFFH